MIKFTDARLYYMAPGDDVFATVIVADDDIYTMAGVGGITAHMAGPGWTVSVWQGTEGDFCESDQSYTCAHVALLNWCDDFLSENHTDSGGPHTVSWDSEAPATA